MGTAVGHPRFLIHKIGEEKVSTCRFSRTEERHFGQKAMSRVARKNIRLWPKLLLAAVVVAAVGFALFEYVDWPGVRQWMQHLNRPVLVLLSATLPLFGFSISIVYLVIGAVFGGPWGIVVVAGITAVHLLTSHWFGRGFLRLRLQRWLEKRKKHFPTLPPGEEISVALMMALVPGPPYFVRNYLLAVSDVPLRVYFWVCWPVYVARSCVVLFLGDLTGEFSSERLVILGSIFVLKVGICAYILHRLRKRIHRIHVEKKAQRTPLQKRLARIGRLD